MLAKIWHWKNVWTRCNKTSGDGKSVEYPDGIASKSGTLFCPSSGERSIPGMGPLENVETGETDAPTLSLRWAPDPEPTEVDKPDEWKPLWVTWFLGDIVVAATPARIW